MLCKGYRGATFAVATSAVSPWTGSHIQTFRASRKVSPPRSLPNDPRTAAKPIGPAQLTGRSVPSERPVLAHGKIDAETH